MSGQESTRERVIRLQKTVIELRKSAKVDPDFQSRLNALKQWQSQRLAKTHHDLLHHDKYQSAAKFFLEDLYSLEDLSDRDAEVERVIPKLASLLPSPVLSVAEGAIELDCISETLDQAMARALGSVRVESIDEAVYSDSYREVGQMAARQRQIELMWEMGLVLNKLVKLPLLGGLLRMTQGPAERAGVGQLHSFVKKGHQAFLSMRNAVPFLETVKQRETLYMQRMWSGSRQPFFEVV